MAASLTLCVVKLQLQYAESALESVGTWWCCISVTAS